VVEEGEQQERPLVLALVLVFEVRPVLAFVAQLEPAFAGQSEQVFVAQLELAFVAQLALEFVAQLALECQAPLEQEFVRSQVLALAPELAVGAEWEQASLVQQALVSALASSLQVLVSVPAYPALAPVSVPELCQVEWVQASVQAFPQLAQELLRVRSVQVSVPECLVLPVEKGCRAPLVPEFLVPREKVL